MQKTNKPEFERVDYESVAARIRNPTCSKQLKRDLDRLEYYDRFDWFFGKWGDRDFPY
jgi:hypothetical protein